MNRAETWQKLTELEIVKGEMPKGAWDLFIADLSGAYLNNADLSGKAQQIKIS